MEYFHIINEWQGGATNFTSLLLGLMRKADLENMDALKKAFPKTYEAHQFWFSGEYAQAVLARNRQCTAIEISEFKTK